MSRMSNIYFIITAAIALTGLLAMQAVSRHSDQAGERQFSEQVNLALRQTAHRLLSLAGDRSSTIPPVQHPDAHSWLIRLNHNFEYDSLPPLLRKAFAQHRVEGDYNVAVLACFTEDLMLGYTATALSTDQDVPCGGREQQAGCYDLRVSFPDRAVAPATGKAGWMLLAFACVLLLAGSIYGLFNSRKKNRLKAKAPLNADERLPVGGSAPGAGSTNDAAAIRFGQSLLYTANQKLVTNGVEKDLTYRETKLLQLFCNHTNQLLERDLILKSVWEDEGVIVGRSVDVFVSRLRKLLQDDPAVRIVNVHGVGYRLEAGDNGGMGE